MKFLPYVLVFAFLPFVVASFSPDLPEAAPALHTGEEIVYYYLDHSCSCSPTAALPEGKYWIITETVYAAERSELEHLAAQYKRFLEREFVAHASMTQDVVIRYQATEELARESRAKKIEKMRDSGYTILEVAFDPEAEVEG